jgi:hypothetical protein
MSYSLEQTILWPDNISPERKISSIPFPPKDLVLSPQSNPMKILHRTSVLGKRYAKRLWRAK